MWSNSQVCVDSAFSQVSIIPASIVEGLSFLEIVKNAAIQPLFKRYMYLGAQSNQFNSYTAVHSVHHETVVAVSKNKS